MHIDEEKHRVLLTEEWVDVFYKGDPSGAMKFLTALGTMEKIGLPEAMRSAARLPGVEIPITGKAGA